MDIRTVHTSELPAATFYGYAYMTASVVDSVGDVTDGWVDPQWSMHVVHDSRNDVRPVATWSRMDDLEEGERVGDSIARFIRETVEEHLSAPRDNGDGTWYGEGEDVTPKGDTYTYALHFVASTHAMRRDDVEYRPYF
jgi:hypothetical protein